MHDSFMYFWSTGKLRILSVQLQVLWIGQSPCYICCVPTVIAVDVDQHLEGEVHDFCKTSWFVEFKALSRLVKVRGSCDKPFK